MKVERRHMLLYAVTDRSWLHGQSLVYAVEEVLAGGATMLQLREKHLEHRDFLAQARLMVETRFYRGVLALTEAFVAEEERSFEEAASAAA